MKRNVSNKSFTKYQRWSAQRIVLIIIIFPWLHVRIIKNKINIKMLSRSIYKRVFVKIWTGTALKSCFLKHPRSTIEVPWDLRAGSVPHISYQISSTILVQPRNKKIKVQSLKGEIFQQFAVRSKNNQSVKVCWISSYQLQLSYQQLYSWQLVCMNCKL